MNNKTCIRMGADLQQINCCKEMLDCCENSIQKLASALNLAGNEVRLKILYLLFDQQKMCVCDLSDILKMKIPAISQHLRKMKDGGIVSNEKVAQTIFYSIKPEYKKLLNPFFKMIANNNVLSEIAA
ncbi:MAG: transcriptional regulator [Flavobacteriales bacterium]|nr:MAG: transcriptional regulator [Flavobacteriales bacterium]